LNDHLLRLAFPSWITGKLGDFAWLVFAPFICASVLALFIRSRSQERVVGATAFIFIGVWFVLAKTTPVFHAWTLETLNFILGYRGTVRIDATDLLALPALLIGWQVWRHSDNRRETVKPHAWSLIALGIVATVATSAASEFNGIAVLCSENSKLYSFEYSYQGLPVQTVRSFVSDDGGLKWQDTNSRDALSSCGGRISPEEKQFGPSEFQSNGKKISDGHRLYQVTPEGRIESSLDNARTWVIEMDLSELHSEGHDALYRRAEHIGYTPGPLDGLISAQGHLVLAMGTEGLLVRKPDGSWNWAAAGRYHHEEFGITDHLAVLARYYIFAVPFIWLAALTIGYPFTAPTRLLRNMLIGAWAVTALSAIFIGLGLIGIPLVLILESLLTKSASRKIKSLPPAALMNLSATTLIAGILYLSPLLLWTYGTIPNADLAGLYGLAIGSGVVASSRVYVSRRFPQVFVPNYRLTRQ
jgi:hypothetical protein